MTLPRPRTDETGRYVLELLTHRQAYRAQWERRVLQRTSTEPNQSAVARVIADYLVDSGERSDSPGLHRQIKDRVARLFTRSTLSSETLRWTIAAFGISEDDAGRLWSLFEGFKAGGYIAGEWPPPTADTKPGWRTVSLHELHNIGPDGLPQSHRTVQVIRATTGDLTRYLYRFDTNAVSVKVTRGGLAGPLKDVGGGLHGVEITFTTPLSVGETASLEYLTTFRYAQPPPPEFRRAVVRRVDNLELRVQFDPGRVPATVWWGAWDSLDGPMTQQEPVQLDPSLAAHRYLDGIEAAIVGFAWGWDN